jgi:hypothetical protein
MGDKFFTFISFTFSLSYIIYYLTMTDFDHDTQQINGINNVIRLEGKINNINKVLYLFMNIGSNINHQTQCTNIFSKDIGKYLVDNFSRLKSGTYDFFLDISPIGLYYNQTNKNIGSTFTSGYIHGRSIKNI